MKNEVISYVFGISAILVLGMLIIGDVIKTERANAFDYENVVCQGTMNAMQSFEYEPVEWDLSEIDTELMYDNMYKEICTGEWKNGYYTPICEESNNYSTTYTFEDDVFTRIVFDTEAEDVLSVVTYQQEVVEW